MNTQEKEPSSAYLSPDLSSEEARKARGLESEQPKPVTPESLADKYADTWLPHDRRTARRSFAAGYCANAERNADLAQRLDLATEALKRHGFERGVVNGVVTWVPTKATLYAPWRQLLIIEQQENHKIRTENTALKTAAADYAKAAEASAVLVEKLTQERDALRDTPSPVIAALEEERDALRAELSTAREDSRDQANRALSYQRQLSAAREKERGSFSNGRNLASAQWRAKVEEMQLKLSAANAARENAERHRKALSQYLRAGSLDVDAYLGVYDERDSLKDALEKSAAFKRYVHKRLDGMGIPVDPESPHRAEGCRVGGRLDCVQAAMEKARAEVERLKGEAQYSFPTRRISELEVVCTNRANEIESLTLQCDDLHRQLAEAKRPVGYYHELLQWQAVAVAKNAALKFAAEAFREYETLHNAKGTNDGILKAITNKNYAVLCEDSVYTPPTAALIDALEGAHAEGWSDCCNDCREHSSIISKRAAWLASATRKRYSGGTEAGA